MGSKIREVVFNEAHQRQRQKLNRPVNILFVGPPGALKSTIINIVKNVLEELGLRVGTVEPGSIPEWEKFSLSNFDNKNRDKDVLLIEAVNKLPKDEGVLDLFIRLDGSLFVRQQRIIAGSGSMEYAQTRTEADAAADYSNRPADIVLNTDSIKGASADDMIKTALEKGLKAEKSWVRVLDMGSGTGMGFWGPQASHNAIKRRAAAAFSGGDIDAVSIIGVDNNKDRVKAGRYRGQNIMPMDAVNLGFLSGTFDVVTCFNPSAKFSLKFVRSIIPEVKRVLKSNGEFWIAPWQSDVDNDLQNYHLMLYKNMLKRNGFVAKIQEDASGFKFVIAKKPAQTDAYPAIDMADAKTENADMLRHLTEEFNIEVREHWKLFGDIFGADSVAARRLLRIYVKLYDDVRSSRNISEYLKVVDVMFEDVYRALDELHSVNIISDDEHRLARYHLGVLRERLEEFKLKNQGYKVAPKKAAAVVPMEALRSAVQIESSALRGMAAAESVDEHFVEEISSAGRVTEEALIMPLKKFRNMVFCSVWHNSSRNAQRTMGSLGISREVFQSWFDSSKGKGRESFSIVNEWIDKRWSSIEEEYILRALEVAGGDIKKAAQLLSITEHKIHKTLTLASAKYITKDAAISAIRSNIPENFIFTDTRLPAVQQRAITYVTQDIFFKISLLKHCTAEEVATKSKLLKKRVQNGESLESVLPEAFALFCTASKLATGQEPSARQVQAAVLLHFKRAVDMKCSEGKTLSIAMASYLSTFKGRVEVHTFNNYLSRRDCQDVGGIFSMLGLKTAVIIPDDSYVYDTDHVNSHSPFPNLAMENKGGSVKERMRARKFVYKNCDIIYGMGDIFIFDYMKDYIAEDVDSTVRLGSNPSAVFVDEADSKIIDESLHPLIIGEINSRKTEKHASLYRRINSIADSLVLGRHYHILPNGHNAVIVLTEEGEKAINLVLKTEHLRGAGIMLSPETVMIEAIKAKCIIKPNVHFVKRRSDAVIVDPFTGRLKEEECWANILHQLVEARNNLSITPLISSICQINRINYYRMMQSTCRLGMISGTMDGVADLIRQCFGMEVICVPLQFESQLTKFYPTLVKNDAELKEAVWEEVNGVLKRDSSAIIFVDNIAESQDFYKFLQTKFQENGHAELLGRLNVLNDFHSNLKEFQVIQHLSEPGTVVVATNAAGRGVHIKIGQAIRESEIGGLVIIDTRIGKSRRIAIQREERTARRGEKGYVKPIYSERDPLFAAYLDTIKIEMGRRFSGISERELVDRVQELADIFDKSLIRHALQYDDMLDKVRTQYFSMREKMLQGNFKKMLARTSAIWKDFLSRLSVLQAEENLLDYVELCTETAFQLAVYDNEIECLIQKKAVSLKEAAAAASSALRPAAYAKAA
ncbi:MAG: methyltransferase domain-containing protein [Candidatus Omnitrophica bacterium]|nr:methyltransferase domain-containing protein [Candidatus Omnitrophota bacterium]